MDCNTCKERRAESVPFLVHEADMARMERCNKHTWILAVVLAFFLIASWIGFLLFESQYETVSANLQEITQKADGDSNNRIIGGDVYGSYADDQTRND